jgi:hypothetical protein
MIVAHQTGAQLNRQGADLSETIDSCTAVKQVLRASDLETIKKIEEASGQAVYHSLAWTQALDGDELEDDPDRALSPGRAEEGFVEVSETVGPRLDRNTVIRVSAHPQGSFVRFTTGSGYTQFGGFTTPIVSSFMMSRREYGHRQRVIWPSHPHAVMIPWPDTPTSGPDIDWERRFRRSLGQ